MVLRIFLMFIYFWERERERESQHEWGRGRERGRHRIRSRLRALSCQHRAWHGARGHKPQDHDLSWSQTLNRLSHPGVPEMVSLLSLGTYSETLQSWTKTCLPSAGWQPQLDQLPTWSTPGKRTYRGELRGPACKTFWPYSNWVMSLKHRMLIRTVNKNRILSGGLGGPVVWSSFFSSGHDLTSHDVASGSLLSQPVSAGPASDPLSPSLSAPSPLMLSFSKINKTLKKSFNRILSPLVFYICSIITSCCLFQNPPGYELNFQVLSWMCTVLDPPWTQLLSYVFFTISSGSKSSPVSFALIMKFMEKMERKVMKVSDRCSLE